MFNPFLVYIGNKENAIDYQMKSINIFRFIFFNIFIITLLANNAFAQTMTSFGFVQTEAMFGKIVPTNTFIPKTDVQQRYEIRFGKYNIDENNTWQSFYNYPITGLSFEYAKLGLDSIFGHSWSVVPSVEFRTGKKISKNPTIHIGLGASYLDSPFDSISNPTNKAVGSHFAWAFHLLGYVPVYVGNNFILRLGGGYLHNSNGHVKLPNFGLNSATLNLSAQFLYNRHNVSLVEVLPEHTPNLTKYYGLEYRQGLGFQALGGTAKPISAPIRKVFSSELSASVLFRRYFKFYGGLTYRYYENFNKYIIDNQIDRLFLNPQQNASSIYLFLGTELMFGHVSLDIQGGLTLFKPFYKTFDEVFQHSSKFDYWLKYLFPTRMGIKLYLKDNQSFPKYNFWTGAHIAANFGEADFTELSLGCVFFFQNHLKHSL